MPFLLNLKQEKINFFTIKLLIFEVYHFLRNTNSTYTHASFTCLILVYCNNSELIMHAARYIKKIFLKARIFSVPSKCITIKDNCYV